MGKYFPQFYQNVPAGGGAPVGSTSFNFGAFIGSFLFTVGVIGIAVRAPVLKKIVKAS